MATKTKSRPLIEQEVVGTPGAPALKIDREKGIIFGVKVLGRYSRNNHGLVEAENGSEYSPACMRSALPMYEGAKVKLNHPPDRSKPGAERTIDGNYGVLRNVRIESEADGVRADLHYLKTHRMTPEILEDVERQFGLWGLSHNAAGSRERFDRANKRLVIEELAVVRSVDLVDKPATNRNLWESHVTTVNTSLRELLESRRPKLSKARRKWADCLLEDDSMAPVMDSPVEGEAGGSEEDALWNGFVTACMAILNGDGSAADKGKKITNYLKAHEKLTGAAEPEAPADVEESEDDEPNDKKLDKERSESELAELRAEKSARELCESLGYTPTTLQVEAVAGIKNAKRQRELAESYKPAGGKTTPASGFKPPRSSAPGTVKGQGQQPQKQPVQRETLESEKDAKETITDCFRIVRG